VRPLLHALRASAAPRASAGKYHRRGRDRRDL
jgi:hypothetical protein